VGLAPLANSSTESVGIPIGKFAIWAWRGTWMRSNEKQKRNLVIEIKDRREGDGVGDIIYGMEWIRRE